MRKGIVVLLPLLFAVAFSSTAFAMFGVMAPDVEFSSDNRFLAYSSGTTSGQVFLRDLETGETTALPKHQTVSIYNGIDFSADGKILVGAAENMFDGVCLWDVGERKIYQIGLVGGNLSAVFNPYSQVIASIDSNGRIIVNDLEKFDMTVPDVPFGGFSEKGIIEDITPPPSTPYGICFSPDGRLLAVGADSIRLYSTRTWQEVRTLINEMEISWPCQNGLNFSPDGKILASISGKGNDSYGYGSVVLLWDWERGEVQRELDCTIGGVSSICFSPGGEYLACGNVQKSEPELWRVEIIDTRTGNSVLKLRNEMGIGLISGIDFSPDGKLIAWVTKEGECTMEDITDIADPSLKYSTLITAWGSVKQY